MDQKKEDALISEVVTLIKENKRNPYLIGYLKTKGVKKAEIPDLVLKAKLSIWDETFFMSEFRTNCYLNQYLAILTDVLDDKPSDPNNIAYSYMRWVEKQRIEDENALILTQQE